jgi:ATP-dependent Clp protease ATP-binding subunit ClpC
MFERYTERARRVVFFARYEASACQSSSLDTEHLLLGLLREGAGVQDLILERSGVTYDLVRSEVESRTKPEAPMPTSVDMPLSAKAKLVLQHAGEEARWMGSRYVDNDHLLLGLLREEGTTAAEILIARGLALEPVREQVRLRSPAKDAFTAPKDPFSKLAAFLSRLEDRRASYHVSAFDEDAIRVEVARPGEKWAATFFADARVTVEMFSSSGTVEDEGGLARLLERLEPPATES